MEKIKKNLESTKKEQSLEDLGREIARIKEEEMRKKDEWLKNGMKGEAYDPHFDRIDVNYLTNEDLEVYKKFQEGDLLKEEFLNYKENIKNELRGIYNTLEGQSRHDFQAWLSNKILALEFERLLKKKEEEKNKQ